VIAVHLLELSFFQRLNHVADKIAPRHDFQSPFVDPCLRCVGSTLFRQAPRVFLANRTRYNVDVLKFPLSQEMPC
jgi:hypothetical protein